MTRKKDDNLSAQDFSKFLIDKICQQERALLEKEQELERKEAAISNLVEVTNNQASRNTDIEIELLAHKNENKHLLEIATEYEKQIKMLKDENSKLRKQLGIIKS